MFVFIVRERTRPGASGIVVFAFHLDLGPDPKDQTQMRFLRFGQRFGIVRSEFDSTDRTNRHGDSAGRNLVVGALFDASLTKDVAASQKGKLQWNGQANGTHQVLGNFFGSERYHRASTSC